MQRLLNFQARTRVQLFIQKGIFKVDESIESDPLRRCTATAKVMHGIWPWMPAADATPTYYV
jgi:hypothetical protein